jgi:hypothetical protein
MVIQSKQQLEHMMKKVLLCYIIFFSTLDPSKYLRGVKALNHKNYIRNFVFKPKKIEKKKHIIEQLKLDKCFNTQYFGLIREKHYLIFIKILNNRLFLKTYSLVFLIIHSYLNKLFSNHSKKSLFGPSFKELKRLTCN